MLEWENRPVLITGGASFIGSHLVDSMVKLGASLRVVDDLSSGEIENIKTHINDGQIEFMKGDLRNPGLAQQALAGMNTVFHLAADHGGRGYVDLHQASCATNLALDGIVFLACRDTGVERIIYASSGCVYPNYLQTDLNQEIYLKEDMVKPPYDADNMYGWAKLMGELTLKAYCQEWGHKGVSCRYFTVYGDRGKENHAVISMIARAFVEQDPFIVWGNGRQIRNWTHVSDIVTGTILAAEKIEDGTAINLGTMERTSVIDAAQEVLNYTGHKTEIKLQPDMPTGPINRVADNNLARELLGWEPKVSFNDGLHKTIDWYFSTKNRDEVRKDLKRLLTER